MDTTQQRHSSATPYREQPWNAWDSIGCRDDDYSGMIRHPCGHGYFCTPPTRVDPGAASPVSPPSQLCCCYPGQSGPLIKDKDGLLRLHLYIVIPYSHQKIGLEGSSVGHLIQFPVQDRIVLV